MGGPETREVVAQTSQENAPESQSQLPRISSDKWNLSIPDSGPDDNSEKVGELPPLSPQCTPPCLHEKADATFPEASLRSWLVVLGSWCAMLAAMGTMNTIGSFQSYFIEHQLSSYSAGVVGWIFSVYVSLAFLGGVIVRPVFDNYGPKWLILTGSVGLCLTMFLVGICEQYWHFLVVFGFLGGGSTALLYTAAIASVGHYFSTTLGHATGIAVTAGGIGGVVFPLMLEALIPSVGFAWSTRILGFLYVCLCSIAYILIRSRHDPPPEKIANAMPDFRIFKDTTFAVTVLGVYLLEWAFFVPVTYISSYALHQGFSTDFSYVVLVILNVGSVFGRWLPGFYADTVGRYNSMILTTAVTVVSVLGVWLPAGGSKAGLVGFALTFGFASGSNLSLTPFCIRQLCHTKNYGRYYATCYTIVSIGCLTGIPIGGEIVARNHGDYWGLIVFVGACYVGALVAFVVVRVLETGWNLKVVC